MTEENKVNEGEFVLYNTVLSIYNYYNMNFTKEVNNNIISLLNSLENNMRIKDNKDIDTIELIERITYQD